MIKSDEIPARLRERLPRFAEFITQSVAELGDAVSYPMLGYIVGTLFSEWRQEPSQLGLMHEIQVLFDFTEKALENGDDRARDLFVLEVVEPLIEPENARIAEFIYLGPWTRKELETMKASR